MHAHALTSVRQLLVYKQYCRDHNLTDDSSMLTSEGIKEFLYDHMDTDTYHEHMDRFDHSSINNLLNGLLI